MPKKQATKVFRPVIDPKNMPICDRRSLNEKFRGDRTAYVNWLIERDGKMNPEKK